LTPETLPYRHNQAIIKKLEMEKLIYIPIDEALLEKNKKLREIDQKMINQLLSGSIDKPGVWSEASPTMRKLEKMLSPIEVIVFYLYKHHPSSQYLRPKGKSLPERKKIDEQVTNFLISHRNEDDVKLLKAVIAGECLPKQSLEIQDWLNTSKYGYYKKKPLLNPRARLVMRLRFGLEDNPPQTLEEVGTKIGVKKERVRQICVKNLRLIRECHYRLIQKVFPDLA